MEMEQGILAAMGSFIFVLLAFGLFMYIVQGITFSRMAKNDGLEEIHWFGWVPLLNTVLWFELIRKKLPFESGAGWKTALIYIVLAMIPLVQLITIPFAIWAVYQLFAKYTEKAVLFTVLSLFMIPIPFLYLNISKKPPLF